MFSNIPSANGSELPVEEKVSESSAPLAPSVKVYKPELHGGIMNTLSLEYSKNKSNSEAHTPAVSAVSDEGVSSSDDTPQEAEPAPAVDISDQADELVMADALSEPIPPAEPVQEIITEEPIPSLFEGIGRTSWDDFESPAAQYSTDSFQIPMDTSAAEAAVEISGDADDGQTCDDEAEEDDIDVFELLDFIEDIEFAGMEPEPLRAVQFAVESGDPYNTAFNDPEIEQEEPDEFSLSSSYKFEKK